MEARQQHIADLARYVLPFMEAQGQKEKIAKAIHQFLVLILTAIAAYASAQYFRPISYAEERSLEILLEYSAQQKDVPVSTLSQNLLDHLHVRRLADIRAHQWDEALNRLAEDYR